jgi:hypothetical protein
MLQSKKKNIERREKRECREMGYCREPRTTATANKSKI